MRALTAPNDERDRRRELAWLDAVVHTAARAARLLPALIAPDAEAERARAIAAVRAGAPYEPPAARPRRLERPLRDALELAARLAPEVAPGALAALYRARIDELELEIAILEALGDRHRVRDLVRRRYGTGERVVGGRRLAAVAAEMLEAVRAPTDEPRVVPAEGAGSLAASMRAVARAAGLELEVRVDPRLVASAATGDRVVFVARRRFGACEARRLCVHEVLGHAVASANARAQPLLLFAAGTAGAFGDQEGVAIALERESGTLDANRARTLAARVVATDLVHRGASFVETARHLHRDRGFGVEAAVALTERAHRGGGVARDVAYLDGWLRVDAALARGETTIDELRTGRVSLAALPALRELRAIGLVRTPAFAPRIEDVFPRGPGAGERGRA